MIDVIKVDSDKIEHPIHATKAMMMDKVRLVLYVFGYDYSKHIRVELSERFIKNMCNLPNRQKVLMHPPSWVYDSNIDEFVNVIEKGIELNYIYKTNVN